MEICGFLSLIILILVFFLVFRGPGEADRWVLFSFWVRLGARDGFAAGRFWLHYPNPGKSFLRPPNTKFPHGCWNTGIAPEVSLEPRNPNCVLYSLPLRGNHGRAW